MILNFRMQVKTIQKSLLLVYLNTNQLQEEFIQMQMKFHLLYDSILPIHSIQELVLFLKRYDAIHTNTDPSDSTMQTIQHSAYHDILNVKNQEKWISMISQIHSSLELHDCLLLQDAFRSVHGIMEASPSDLLETSLEISKVQQIQDFFHEQESQKHFDQ